MVFEHHSVREITLMTDVNKMAPPNPALSLSRSLVAADILALLPADSAQDTLEKLPIIIEIDTNSVLPPAQCHSLLLMALMKFAKAKNWKDKITLHKQKSEMTDRYVFLDVTHEVIREFLGVYVSPTTRPDKNRLMSMAANNLSLKLDEPEVPSFAELISMIFRIWRDHPATPLVVNTVSTVKVDAAQNLFSSSRGENIVWAVVDTGVDGFHPHFALHDNLTLPGGLSHIDLTGQPDAIFLGNTTPLNFDSVGHGTHVAGIIAGEWLPTAGPAGSSSANFHLSARAGQAGVEYYKTPWDKPVRGIAPKCKILAIKVLAQKDGGKVSDAIVGLNYIRKQNLNRNKLKIHGVNISLSYPFDPEWYSAGMSPLCKEIDRLVEMGVCVVVAAGNTGYGQLLGQRGASGLAATGTICDPGNAKGAITVGATHRDRPRELGVSYFSSKGPTADGRMKPDLIAPGERVISCKVHRPEAEPSRDVDYCEMSGTSMAAPHVSGAVACLLSARPEFSGRPLAIKQRLLATATDLGLAPTHQGKGLLDVLELITSSYEGGPL
jgi:serine protease AprX